MNNQVEQIFSELEQRGYELRRVKWIRLTDQEQEYKEILMRGSLITRNPGLISLLSQQLKSGIHLTPLEAEITLASRKKGTDSNIAGCEINENNYPYGRFTGFYAYWITADFQNKKAYAGDSKGVLAYVSRYKEIKEIFEKNGWKFKAEEMRFG